MNASLHVQFSSLKVVLFSVHTYLINTCMGGSENPHFKEALSHLQGGSKGVNFSGSDPALPENHALNKYEECFKQIKQGASGYLLSGSSRTT